VSLVSLGEAFPRFSSTFSDLGFAGSAGLIFLFDWISWTYLLGFHFGFSLADLEQYP
jgi:hypothetical protein